MFQSPATIIVGAGASLDFGLPSGPELWATVRNHIANAAKQYLSEELRYYPAQSRLSLFAQGPIANRILVNALDKNPEIAATQIAKLTVAARDADVHASVDDFLLDNPSLTQIVKAIIAFSLFKKLYTEKDGRWHLRPSLTARVIRPAVGDSPALENWPRMFVGLCRNFLRRDGVTDRLVVINFNYDRVMETVLRHFWDLGEGSFPKFEDCFAFIYPYGAFSDLPEEISNPPRWIQDQTATLGFAGTGTDETTTLLRAILSKSQTIFMIGFSCGTANAQLLGLDRHHGPRIFYQNYQNKDTRLNRALTLFETPAAHMDTSDTTNLVFNGFFEQQAPAGSVADDAVYGRFEEAPPRPSRRTARKKVAPKQR